MVDFLGCTRLHISLWNSRKKNQLLQKQDFILVYHSIETLDILFYIKRSIDSYMEYYQEASATSSFSVISFQRIQHQMVNHEFVCQQKILQIISRLESSNSKDSANSSWGPTQAEFLTLKSKCQASLPTATDLEQHRQGLIQTLQQFGDNQDNEETEDITL